MAGGQQINAGHGTLTADGGDNNVAATGSQATATAGNTSNTNFLPLRSRKVGGGTASALLSGQAISTAQGLLVRAKSFALTGQAHTLAQGTLLYRGQATLTWNAVTTNSDGSPITDLAGYRILHGTTSGDYSESVTLGTVTSYVWGGLLPGFTHYFVVQAYDTANLFSGNSAEVSKAY